MQGSSGNGRIESGIARKRGAPVLVELLKKGQGQAPGAAQGAPVEPTLFSPAAKPAARSTGLNTSVEPKPVVTLQLRPAPTEGPAAGAAGASTLPGGGKSLLAERGHRGSGSGGLGGWYRGLGVTGRSVLFAAAAVVVLGPAIWYVAFMRGHSDASAKLGAALGNDTTPARGDRPGVVDPLNQNSTAPTGTPPIQTAPPVPPPTVPVKPEVKPAVPEGPAAVVTEMVKGYNYLIVGTFKRAKDAEDTAAYLTQEGLPTRIMPAKELGAGGSSDQIVVVVYGFAKSSYRQTERERRDLTEQVQRLGAKWKAANKLAPSDLSQPYFARYGE